MSIAHDLEWEQINVDAGDPVTLGHWWQAALDWVVVNDEPDGFEIRPGKSAYPGFSLFRSPRPSRTRTGFTSISGQRTKRQRWHD